MFSLAHISDVHLALPRRPNWRELAGKRATGYFNILRKRGANHQDWAADRIAAAMLAERPDHIAVTGDLINISLPDEYLRGREWLDSLGPPDRISLVPGNHDAYVAVPDEKGLGRWADYMTGDSEGPVAWPYLRRRGQVVLIGVSTAQVTPPFLATGRIGAAQLSRLADMLEGAHREGFFRVLLIHHPPLPVPTRRHKRVVDAAALADTLARAGAELVLHGHNHTDTLCFTPGPGAPIPVVGIPSASAVGLDGHPAAQFNVYRIARNGTGWSIDMTAHRLNPATREIATIRATRLGNGAQRAGYGYEGQEKA